MILCYKGILYYIRALCMFFPYNHHFFPLWQVKSHIAHWNHSITIHDYQPTHMNSISVSRPHTTFKGQQPTSGLWCRKLVLGANSLLEDQRQIGCGMGDQSVTWWIKPTYSTLFDDDCLHLSWSSSTVLQEMYLVTFHWWKAITDFKKGPWKMKTNRNFAFFPCLTGWGHQILSIYWNSYGKNTVYDEKQISRSLHGCPWLISACQTVH